MTSCICHSQDKIILDATDSAADGTAVSKSAAASALILIQDELCFLMRVIAMTDWQGRELK
jgi:hypothetical protein